MHYVETNQLPGTELVGNFSLTTNHLTQENFNSIPIPTLPAISGGVERLDDGYLAKLPQLLLLNVGDIIASFNRGHDAAIIPGIGYLADIALAYMLDTRSATEYLLSDLDDQIEEAIRAFYGLADDVLLSFEMQEIFNSVLDFSCIVVDALRAFFVLCKLPAVYLSCVYEVRDVDKNVLVLQLRGNSALQEYIY